MKADTFEGTHPTCVLTPTHLLLKADPRDGRGRSSGPCPALTRPQFAEATETTPIGFGADATGSADSVTISTLTTFKAAVAKGHCDGPLDIDHGSDSMTVS